MKRTASYYVAALILLAGASRAPAQAPAEEEALGRVVLSGESARTAGRNRCGTRSAPTALRT